MKLPHVPRSLIATTALAVLGVYLFATAPEPLDEERGGRADIPVETLFRLLDAENASVRKIYTAEIVTPGQKQGLKFDEAWKSAHVHAGPLPALLLRETANRLQQRVPELSLFLGSAWPIEQANLFKGTQSDYFAEMVKDRDPRFFVDAGTGRQTAMFPDIASAPACVTCHNEHPKSPRKDWVKDDVMGATTWSFPRAQVSHEEMIEILGHYRAAALDAYRAYLAKVPDFERERRPEVGERWPKDGLYVPDLATFTARVESTNSTASLNLLLGAGARADAKSAKDGSGEGSREGSREGAGDASSGASSATPGRVDDAPGEKSARRTAGNAIAPGTGQAMSVGDGGDGASR